METCDCGYLKVNYIRINIGIRLAYFVTAKSDGLLDHALQYKTIIQYLNLFDIDHYRFISRREHFDLYCRKNNTLITFQSGICLCTVLGLMSNLLSHPLLLLFQTDPKIIYPRIITYLNLI